MATRIIEYGGKDRTDDLQIVPMPVRSQPAMTATSTSTQSQATGLDCDYICVQSDEAIYVARGSNPTATTDNYRIQAGGEQFFDIVPGYKIAIRT